MSSVPRKLKQDLMCYFFTSKSLDEGLRLKALQQGAGLGLQTGGIRKDDET